MGKRILQIFLSLCLLLPLHAQTAREAVSRDPSLALGNMHPYHMLSTQLSEAPQGYELFYVSYTGRHGSRYATANASSNESRYMKTFDRYAREKRFTKEGRQLYRAVKKISGLNAKHKGELSSLGEKEAYGLGLRLDSNAGGLFRGGRKVISYSTASSRVMKTRDCFMTGLLEKNPSLIVDTVEFAKKGKPHTEVVGYDITDKQKKLTNRYTLGDEEWRSYDASDFLGRIFREGRRDGLDRDVAYRFFDAGVNCMSMGENVPDITAFFSADDLYYIWSRRATGWVGRSTVTPENHGYRPLTMGRGIADNIIEDADAVIQGSSDVAATLRFTHDTYLVALLSYLDIEGVNFDPAESAVGNFRDFDIVCMGMNLQLFFYRNAEGRVLVKILLNEKEIPVAGLAPCTGMYYDWQALKEFWNSRASQISNS